MRFGRVLVAPTTLAPAVAPKPFCNLALADSLVLRSQEVINYFNPQAWFTENPQTGLLKDRPFIIGIPFCAVDHCAYCDWGYRKRTRLWNNVNFQGKLCLGPGCCPNMDGKKHKTTAQQGKKPGEGGALRDPHFTAKFAQNP